VLRVALVIEGSIVALDPDAPERVGAGTVYLGDDGLIAAVNGAAPSGFDHAPVVKLTDAWVFPGVIDLHNHVAYNTLPLWTEKSQSTAFLHHNDWTDEASYQPDISWPAWTLAHCEPEALLAYVLAKAVIGGTTAIQGFPGSNTTFDNWLVRSIDNESFGTADHNLVYTSTLTLQRDALKARATTMRDGRGFIYHCAEGQPGSIVAREFEDVDAADCLRERLIAIHCNAVTNFGGWHARPGAVVWSPFSNLWLYGVTTDVAAARQAGVTVCLGSDWGPSGTKHVLGELKVAKIWSDKHLGLSNRALVEMVTANPGDVLARCWPHRSGRIVTGALGDLTVVTKRTDDPWLDLITTRERDVVLVVIGGVARYGLDAPMKAAGTMPAGAITIAGGKRRMSLPGLTDPTKQWSLAAIRKTLNAVRANPAEALRRADAPHAGPRPSRIELTLDMPFGGGTTAGPPPDPATLKIPKLDGFVHDAAWLRTIHNRGFHGGVLDALAAFYR
jgi:cytosine/adenosine deaminase-related metal-dependent hydrolase